MQCIGVLEKGLRTGDIMPLDPSAECVLVGTDHMADEVIGQLREFVMESLNVAVAGATGAVGEVSV